MDITVLVATLTLGPLFMIRSSGIIKAYQMAEWALNGYMRKSAERGMKRSRPGSRASPSV
jgi:hypothetical protein